MELKTTCSAKGTICGSLDGLDHDAAAAHALMKAMDELYSGSVCNYVIKDRADELMREWGFEQERVG